MKPDFAYSLAIVLGATGFFGACIGIFKAAWSISGFFRSASTVLSRIPTALETQATIANDMLRAAERQSAAMERSADLVPMLDKYHAAQQQVGTELRVMSREIRQLVKQREDEISTGETE